MQMMMLTIMYCGRRPGLPLRWSLVVLITAVLFIVFTAAGPLPAEDAKTTAASTPPRKAGQHKLLLILLDGYRWDYPSRVRRDSAFDRIKAEGIMAKYLEPVFPTMSFPNYQSLVTGLNPENHGIVMNYMFDEERNAFFKMLPSTESIEPFWWDQAEPIWIEAAKANLRSHLFNWPGCDAYNQSFTDLVVCKPYRSVEGLDDFQYDVDDAVQLLADDKTDLVQIYLEDPDAVGHKDGPESPSVTKSINALDTELNFLLDLLDEFIMEKKVVKTTVSKSRLLKKDKKKKVKKVTYVAKVKVNVIIVSDHGMTATDDKHVKRVSLDSAVDLNDVQYVLGNGAVVGVHPKSDKIDKVYDDLSRLDGISVWKKSDIPERYHLNHTRTPPILVLAKKGYFIEAILNSDKQIPYAKFDDADNTKGYHGYSPEIHDMRGIFYAFGPAFEKGRTLLNISTVDVYNVMAHVLDIEPHPNNGSMAKVARYLKPTSAASSILFGIRLGGGGGSGMPGIAFMCFACLYASWFKA